MSEQENREAWASLARRLASGEQLSADDAQEVLRLIESEDFWAELRTAYREIYPDFEAGPSPVDPLA